MVIKDKEGLYEIRVDTQTNIVYQIHNKGLFTAEAVKRLDNDYRTKVIPLLEGKKWAKLCDLRNYQMTSNVDEMNAHNAYCIEHGMVAGALVMDSAVLKLQMSRSGKAVNLEPNIFSSVEEAEKWLKSQGF